MKTILFLRHAKSDWKTRSGLDHERTINAGGRRDARLMGEFLAAIQLLPERIVTSSAVRAKMTLDTAMEAGGWGDIPVAVTDALYEASEGDVLALIQAQSDTYDRLLLVGHEPTWSSMIGRLVGRANIVMPTGSMACVDLEIPSWKVAAFERGQLRWLVPPKLRRTD